MDGHGIALAIRSTVCSRLLHAGPRQHHMAELEWQCNVDGLAQ